MTQQKKIVPLKKIISSNFDKAVAKKYLKGIDLDSDDTVYINPAELYQAALNKLLDGDSEKAINYIIFALDFDRNDKLILHLSKIMIFSLSQYLVENNADFFRQKYGGNLEDIETKLRKKIKDLNEIINKLTYEVKQLENIIDNGSKSFIFRLFKLPGFKRQKEAIQSNVYNYKNEIEGNKKDLSGIEKNLRVDEYVRILSLIIEVCVFPTRFEWILSQS
jgi:hypothetical protein